MPESFFCMWGQRHESCELGSESAIGTNTRAICITLLSVSCWCVLVASQIVVVLGYTG